MVVIENNTGRVLAMVGGYDSSSHLTELLKLKDSLDRPLNHSFI